VAGAVDGCLRSRARGGFVSAAHGQVSLPFMVLEPTIQIASLGMADSLILMVLALVVFGPRRLPQIGRQIGKLMYEFRKASNDFKYQMEEELRNAEEADRRKKEEERLKALALAAPALAIESPGPQTAATDETPAMEVPATEAIVESPYPEEGQYPYVGRTGIEPVETVPTIQPPSTGEQVPAARPWNLEEELAKISGVGTDAEASTELSPPHEEGHSGETSPASVQGAPEQAIHHG